MACPRNSHRHLPILTRACILDFCQHQLMDLSNIVGRDGRIALHEPFDIINRLSVVDDFKMLAQRFAPDSEAMLKDQLGFS